MTDTELNSLAEQFETPLYVFDMRQIARRAEHLSSFMPANTKLCYAMKANPFVLSGMMEHVDYLEVCSSGELSICENLGIDPQRIVVSGVHKEARRMESLAAKSRLPHRFTIESHTQLSVLDKIGQKSGRVLPAILRLSSGNQFGLDEDELRTIVERRDRFAHVDLRGIQFFSGTQKNRPKRIIREMSHLDRILGDLIAQEGWEANELEYGPGLPVSYFAADKVSEDELLETLADSIEHLEHAAHVTLEIGRSLAASCGTYLTRIVDTKTCSGQRYAIVDGGIHQLVYFGQSMAMHQPPCHLISENGCIGEPLTWNICGSLCTVNDILAKQLPLSDLRPGSLLAFERSGAYSATEGIALFLSHDLPRVALIDQHGRADLARASVPTHPLNTPHGVA